MRDVKKHEGIDYADSIRSTRPSTPRSRRSPTKPENADKTGRLVPDGSAQDRQGASSSSATRAPHRAEGQGRSRCGEGGGREEGDRGSRRKRAQAQHRQAAEDESRRICRRPAGGSRQGWRGRVRRGRGADREGRQHEARGLHRRASRRSGRTVGPGIAADGGAPRVLDRREGRRIRHDRRGRVVVTVLEKSGKTAKLGFDAEKDIPINKQTAFPSGAAQARKGIRP
jgi:hypothetical protein